MAHSLSSKKRIRQNETRRLRNLTRKKKLKKALRTYQDTLAGGDEAAIQSELRKAQRALDKAGTKGILHRKNVDRRKARLALAANRPRAAAAGADAAATA